jgi:hypothetical protein
VDVKVEAVMIESWTLQIQGGELVEHLGRICIRQVQAARQGLF